MSRNLLKLIALTSLLPGRYGLTIASVHLDHLLWSGWVPGFHLTNVLLHAVATALVTAMALTLGAGRAAALWCGLLFAVHPVHVEAVASVENRKEILAAIFAATDRAAQAPRPSTMIKRRLPAATSMAPTIIASSNPPTAARLSTGSPC